MAAREKYTLGKQAPRVTLVIPARNEARNLPWVLERVPAGLHEVILVDGNSTDDTVQVAKEYYPSIKVIQQRARGKGAALITGMLAATGDIVTMIDADGSMDPIEIHGLVGALLSGADVVKSSRYLAGGGSGDISRLRDAGNRGLNLVGRRTGGNSRNYGANSFPSAEAAAADFWRIVRAKTGKGYQVVDAAVFEVQDDAVVTACTPPHGFSYPNRDIIDKWDAVQRGVRRSERQAILNHPDIQVRTPRTPKEGKALLVALTDPECPSEVLMECALAAPNERFLIPMGLSHPACPEEVKVAHYLARSAAFSAV